LYRFDHNEHSIASNAEIAMLPLTSSQTNDSLVITFEGDQNNPKMYKKKIMKCNFYAICDKQFNKQ